MSSRIFLPALSVAGALLAAPASGTLIITGVFDGPLPGGDPKGVELFATTADRKSTRLNSSHVVISYAVFCLKKKTINPS